MSLELNEAGMTFLVGAFVLLAFEAVGYFIFGRHFLHFFEGRLGLSREGNMSPAVTTGAFIGLSFALGLLVEDICHKYDDSHVDWPLRLPTALRGNQSVDANMKLALQHDVLIQEFREERPALSGLGRAVFDSGLFATFSDINEARSYGNGQMGACGFQESHRNASNG